MAANLKRPEQDRSFCGVLIAQDLAALQADVAILGVTVCARLAVTAISSMIRAGQSGVK